MAIYYLGMKSFGRSRGKSGSRSTSAAAYRAGERIHDERTGHVYDHQRRMDVMHKEIVLPARLASQAASLAWARDRARLWNAAEHAESRANARVAREFTVALPHELSAEARTLLARRFAHEIADRYQSAVDVAIHAPRGDARNFHAHLLATTREVTPDGLGRKTTLELSGTERARRGLPRWREEIASIRERWAALTNEALERAHVPVRVSHLSRAERGLAPAPQPRLPLAAYHMERRGARSFIAERVRERYRAMLERTRSLAAALRSREPRRELAREHVHVGEHAREQSPGRADGRRGAPALSGWSFDRAAEEAARAWYARREGRHAAMPGMSFEEKLREYSRESREQQAKRKHERDLEEEHRLRHGHDHGLGL